MRKLFILLAMAGFLVNCGEGEIKPLTPAEYSTLFSLNEMQSDNDMAIAQAVGEILTPMSREKVDRLTNLIMGRCVASGRRPALTFDRNENHGFTVNGSDCPINFRQNQIYNVNLHEWSIYELFAARMNNYAEVGGMSTRTIRGKIRKQDLGDGNSSVTGDIDIYDFNTTEFGKLTATINTNHSTYDNVNRGTITMTIRSTKGWEHTAKILWEGNSPADFQINRKDYERKDFEELFSSYGLIEIMENSKKLR